MSDRDPAATTAAVSRGMRAHLARRDAALAAGAAAGGLEDRLQHARHPGALRADRRRRRLPGRHRGVAGRGHGVAGRLGGAGRRGRGRRPGRGRRRRSPGWRPRWSWWTSTSPSTTSSRCWPATSATAASSSATRCPASTPGPWWPRVTKAGDVVAEGRLGEDPATTVTFVRSYLDAHGATLEAGRPDHRRVGGGAGAVAPGDELASPSGRSGHLSVRFGPDLRLAVERPGRRRSRRCSTSSES